MKKLLALMLCWALTAQAQVHSNFQSGQILTAAELNTAFLQAASVAGGVLTGPLTVPSLSVTGVTLLNTPLGAASGGTGMSTFTIGSVAVGALDGTLTTIAPGTSGYVLTSAGPGALPVYATVPSTALAPQPANTLLANFTAGTAAPSAVALATCNVGLSALQYVAGVGLVCNTPVTTGSGAVVLNTSPSLITPNLGTPSTITLTNGTGLPVAGITGLGTGVGMALGSAVTGSGSIVLDTSPTLTTPALGIPSSVTLTNGTGLPVASGLSGLGTGVATALGAAVTGSGGIVLATSPSITTPTITGITSGSAAGSGVVSQVISHSTTGTAITSGATVNADSISVPAGDWDCWGQVLYLPTATAVVAQIAAGFNTVSATLAASPDSTYLGVTLATGTNGITSINVFTRVTNVSTTTTLFLTALAGSVTIATATVNGYTSCRRRR